MADFTIAPDELGKYELALSAGTAVTVAVESNGAPLQVLVHTATQPVYARAGSVVTAKDPKATMIMPGTWAEVPQPLAANTVALISAAAATVSVTRV